ncbi:uncharacterized protein LOC119547214 [Drosophila subpulchrella]|uniref:uncharacterized protein LOC119547214 n=1 Tax=Drosophila subpulchrella TaxID=1486046 RepID=UPI0018A1A1EC|nr:uncharacterized protein LOC119547214 [Drosophila subpulchrella]
MKAITSIVLGSVLVLSLLKNVTYAIELNLNLPAMPNYPSNGTLQCSRGFHIVVRKGTLFHNGNRNEKAWYWPKMACDLEQTCDFELVRDQYNYLNLARTEAIQLTIKYDCKQDDFQGTLRRIIHYRKNQNCPNDSFLQKHVAYFNDNNIASDTQAAKMDREVIAMSVCAQVRRFRERNPGTPIDPYLGTVFLIHQKSRFNQDFKPDPRENSKCQLTNEALRRSFKYDCRRDANKWTCNMSSKGRDVAKHDKNNSHLG